ncbi:uncharacterized protein A4U43_C04F17010 [Asparagus officinalis]|uniref:Uncharacterized protein n=1 Tax=Asparagus officinalis TaxID=4686 RepID=A0A5P1F399_ASPOF|nr:uncharacterized protein A4U43_C04F17010 [Asparagus officinalis]
MNGAWLQSVFTLPPCVAQSSAFHTDAYIFMGWLIGYGFGSLRARMRMGMLSTRKRRWVAGPEEGVGVEAAGGVEPEGVAYLPGFPCVDVDVCLEEVGLAETLPRNSKSSSLTAWAFSMTSASIFFCYNSKELLAVAHAIPRVPTTRVMLQICV